MSNASFMLQAMQTKLRNQQQSVLAILKTSDLIELKP